MRKYSSVRGSGRDLSENLASVQLLRCAAIATQFRIRHSRFRASDSEQSGHRPPARSAWPRRQQVARQPQLQTGRGSVVSSSRSSGSMSRSTRMIEVRRCFIILLTSRLPAPVRLNVMLRRSSGASWRSSKPARMRRSQMRLAFDGLTPRPAATAARFNGPFVSTITKTRNCGTVTSSSTAAMDAAAMPTSARDARNTTRRGAIHDTARRD